MKDTSLVGKKEENHVVDEEDPQKHFGNPFARVHNGEEDDYAFWQPIWCCTIITLFSDPTCKTHDPCISFLPKTQTQIQFELGFDSLLLKSIGPIHKFNEVQKPVPNWIFFSYKMGFS